jgi:thiol-disulfide isomerase/thioredoxin
MRERFLACSLILGTLMAMSAMAGAPTLVGRQAPDFVLKAMDGTNLRLSEFRGQVVLVNFWARWAGDSRQEMPALDRINATYSRAGLVVLGVSVDEDFLPDPVRYRCRYRTRLFAAENAHDDSGGSCGRRALLEHRLQARR